MLSNLSVNSFTLYILFVLLLSLGFLSGTLFAPIVFIYGVLSFGSGVFRCRNPSLIHNWRRGFTAISVVAGLFSIWLWVTLLWSIDSVVTIRSTIQLMAIWSGSLLFLAAIKNPQPFIPRPFIPHSIIQVQRLTLVKTMLLVFSAAVAFLAVDRLTGFSLNPWLKGSHQPFAYNRGIAYVMLVVLPIAGYLWHKKSWFWLALLALVSLVAMTVGVNWTVRFATAAALVVVVIAYFAPRKIRTIITALVAILWLAAPWLVRSLEQLRHDFAQNVKGSFLHRLEIWDYVSARIIDRPWSGWGLGNARHLPITEAEKLSYLWAGGEGIYPHNQLLQLWVETGFVGVLLFLIFLWLVIKAIARLPAWQAPWGYGAFTAAMTTSLVNYEITTDSWWAAIAATTAVFILLRQAK